MSSERRVAHGSSRSQSENSSRTPALNRDAMSASLQDARSLLLRMAFRFRRRASNGSARRSYGKALQRLMVPVNNDRKQTCSSLDILQYIDGGRLIFLGRSSSSRASMLFRIRMDALRPTAGMVDTTMLPNISRKNVAKMCRRNVERGIDMLLVEVGLAWRRPQLNLIDTSWFSLDTHQCRPHISVQIQ